MNLITINTHYKKIVFVYLLFVVTLFCVTVLYPSIFNTSSLFIGYSLSVLALVLLVAIKLLTQSRINEKHIIDNYTQLEALQQISSYINPPLPFPPTGDWAATADYIKEIFISILVNKPKVILEIGSGVSSLYIGQLIKEHKLDCVLYSLENASSFAEISKNNNALYGVEKQVKLTLSEIKKHTINNKEWLWYDTAFLKEIGKIDMLLVDGPSMLLQKTARYPAMPLVFEHLSKGASILIDDYNRPDEQKMVRMWTKEYNTIKVLKTSTNVKGFCLLKKE